MKLLPSRHSLLALIHDVAMAGLSFWIALFLRVGTETLNYSPGFLALNTAVLMAVTTVVFLVFRISAGVWRYTSLIDMMGIVRAATLTVILFVPILFLITRAESLPRSVPVIIWFVLIALLGGPRVLYRALKDRRVDFLIEQGETRPVPVLLVGAGDAAELFIRAVHRGPGRLYRAVGIVGLTSKRVGQNIQGIPVLGTTSEIPAVIERLDRRGERPQRLVLTRDNLPTAEVRDLLETATSLGLTLARLPRLTDFREGSSEERIEVRPVAIEDLLGRPQAVLDRDSMRSLISGRRVLVTGAGGTIGGELVRQIATFGPTRLALLDAGEFNLYTIDMEMAEHFPAVPRQTILADVRDRQRLDHIMGAEAPELVFHAAALKHVPMVEANPFEGVLTNVVGTRNVADACRAAGVRLMVQISTDKAVNPTNVMGASKRIAEMYCQALDLQRAEEGTRFVTVRFGNVLGSTGSVIPLFQRQIARGGPITVTHPEIQRYFMTVREAVELVLQASVLGNKGDGAGRIFVLDMGEPVKIIDLARQMIRLAGLRPEADVKIEITGLRPGEKLYEEVFHAAEELLPTSCKGLLLAAPRTTEAEILRRTLSELEETARGEDQTRLDVLLRHLVPEYGPMTQRASIGEPVRSPASKP